MIGAARARRSGVVLLLSLALARAVDAQERAGTREITVYAAASLAEALLELAPLAAGGQSGARVRYNFAGSQQLAAQLGQGAPADVFASADRRWMEYVEQRGLTAGPSRIFAHSRLVVILPRSNPAGITRLEDLARPGVKLVLGADAVPVGRYTRVMLERLASSPGYPRGWRDAVLANVVSEEESVKGIAAKVQLAEADAGVVYQSDVSARVAPSLTVLQIPERANVLASYAVAVLAGAGDPAAARAFVDLLLGSEGRQVLARHRLIPAGASP